MNEKYVLSISLVCEFFKGKNIKEYYPLVINTIRGNTGKIVS